jgi:hypothetical protein
MTTILEGFYKHGHIELRQAPPDLPEGPVRVIVMAPEPAKPPPCYLTYGKYQGEQSTLEDFKVAEWHGDEELENQHGQ